MGRLDIIKIVTLLLFDSLSFLDMYDCQGSDGSEGLKLVINPGPSYNFTRLYQEAKLQYLDEQWRETIDSFEALMIKWSAYQNELDSCRRDCPSDENWRRSHVFDARSSEMVAIHAAGCLLECRPNSVCDRKTEDDLRRNVPFNYLQLAYFK